MFLFATSKIRSDVECLDRGYPESTVVFPLGQRCGAGSPRSPGARGPEVGTTVRPEALMRSMPRFLSGRAGRVSPSSNNAFVFSQLSAAIIHDITMLYSGRPK